MIFGGFSVRFGFSIGVGIRSFGWINGFSEGSFVDWTSFKVCCVVFSA